MNSWDIFTRKSKIFELLHSIFTSYVTAIMNVLFFSYVSNDTNDDNIKKYQLRSFTNFNPNLNIAYDF